MSSQQSHTADSANGAEGAKSMVDWGLAVATARRLVRPGPAVSTAEARRVVADLKTYAAVAEEHVQGFTGLRAAGSTAPVVVVDRPGWVQANADAFAKVLTPLTDRMQERRSAANGSGAGHSGQGGRSGQGGPGGAANSFVAAVGSRLTGVEAGALLAFLSGKVLGQFDPFDGDEGRLLLVAPNVVHVERELGVDARDFRLWVCLHEETHRVQFTAVPWMRDYFRGQIKAFLDKTDVDPAAMAAQLRDGIEQLGKVLRGDSEASIIDIVQTPEQKEVLDRLTALMSLLEGHADVVMDGVGPDVVPSVAAIREKFQQRRSSGSFTDQLLKRLLGLDAKLRQYRDGAKFVRHAIDQVGMSGFNKVWEDPANLPTREEIVDPAKWVDRVHPRELTAE